jgi:integrase
MNTVEPIRDLRQIDAMKKMLKADGIRNWLFFTMGINSALRVSDLLRLRQADVFDARDRVLDAVRIREKKTGKEKVFRLNKSAGKALGEYIQDEATGHDPQAYLFRSRKGDNRPISRTQAWQIISDAAKAVGLNGNIGTHSMRKTWGYHQRKSGTDLTVIMAALNHSSQSQTLRYVGISQDDTDDAYDAVNL